MKNKKYNLKSYIMLATGLMLMPIVSHGATVTGTINSFYKHTNKNSTASIGYVEFNMVAPGLAEPCKYLFVEPNDYASFSVVLSAKLKNLNVTVYYDPAKSSPWSNVVCAATIVKL